VSDVVSLAEPELHPGGQDMPEGDMSALLVVLAQLQGEVRAGNAALIERMEAVRRDIEKLQVTDDDQARHLAQLDLKTQANAQAVEALVLDLQRLRADLEASRSGGRFVWQRVLAGLLVAAVAAVASHFAWRP
jgi:hypothetical protein